MAMQMSTFRCFLSSIFCNILCIIVAEQSLTSTTVTLLQRKRVNVILILADDLGYGDLGWAPFVSKDFPKEDNMKNVKTPHLQKMAQDGMILTNFHTASPVCSPSRASILVGLFPWRLGVDFIYAGDLKNDGSEEINHEQLPLIPNVAMSFKEAGYYTAHIGKWHLGGMSHTDIPSRVSLRSINSSIGCHVPGILQYGFDEYVGMSEGPKGSRYITHQAHNTYTTGARYLIKNDHPLPSRGRDEILTDRQTEEALRVISEQTSANRPFFLNVWYDAPHSPWEAIQPYFDQYRGKFATERLQKYASMISNMDENIGKLLKLVDSLGISDQTLIVFTSDNGPENGAGSQGPFKGRKRLLGEGGIRVPAIVRWKGHVKAGSSSDKFVLTTDLFPTFAHAAKIKMPSHIRIDGVSVLPMLLDNSGRSTLHGDERTVVWYSHCPGLSKYSAAWSHGYKLQWNDYEGRQSKNLPPSMRLIDMRSDPFEEHNLLPNLLKQGCSSYNNNNVQSSDITSWSQIAEMSRTVDDKNIQKILLLVNYLQLKMHLFRYLGDFDWRQYHSNKPYEVHATCELRKSSIESLSWSSHIIAPEFCGDSISIELQKPFCRCALSSECAVYWKDLHSKGWTAGLLDRGLSSIAAPDSPLESFIRDTLEWSNFNPLCNGFAQRSTAISKVNKMNVLNASCYFNHHSSSNWLSHLADISTIESSLSKTIPMLPNGGWALGDHIGHSNPTLATISMWSDRQCHQRLHTRGRHVHMSGTNCGRSKPLFTISYPAMHAPLSLCSDSFEAFSGSSLSSKKEISWMDDNVFLVTLNDRLKSSSPPSLAFKQIGIIDPLFFHSLNATEGPIAEMLSKSFNNQLPLKLSQNRDGTSSSISVSVSELSSSIHFHSNNAHLTNLWGFFSAVEHRLKLVNPQDRVEILVMPLYHGGCWGVVILGGLSQPPPHHAHSHTHPKSSTHSSRGGKPYAVLYFPLLKFFTERTVEFMDFLRHQLSIIVRIIHPNFSVQSEDIVVINASNPFAGSGLDEIAAFHGMHRDSGVEVILFTELAIKLIGEQFNQGRGGAVNEDILMKIAKQSRKLLTKETIAQERQSMISTLQAMSDKDMRQLKQHLQFQSKEKYRNRI